MASTSAGMMSSLRRVKQHATPLSLRIQSIPPVLRRPQDWHRNLMDTLIEDDTRDVHWELDEPSSKIFLETLFPDDALLVNSFEDGSVLDFSLCTIPSLLDYLRKKGHYGPKSESQTRCGWLSLPTGTNSSLSEETVSSFFNDLIEVIQSSIGRFRTPRSWDSFNASVPLKGATANRKPDLLLSAIGSPNGHEADWRDVVAIGEVKSKKDTKTIKASYIESAGKAAFVLYAQDGRHAVPCIRILGSHIFFDIFDRGGSISTAGFDIHDHPEVFLRILLGLATASMLRLGFDPTIRVDSSVQPGEQTQRKRMTIQRDGVKISLVLDYLIFITDGLHGRGSTVWKAWMDSDVDVKGKGVGRKRGRSEASGKDVVVKDCWIDPLRKYTEGMILDMLNKAGVNGVPKLISEEQVTINHPSPTIRTLVNNSTHLLRTLALPEHCPIGDIFYHLRVQSRLVTEPVGYLVTSFSCLGELLVAFIDYATAHQEALEKAFILHRDISLLNLLLVLCQRGFNYERIPGSVAISLERRLKGQGFRRGLLADWGYAVPIRAGAPEQDSDSGIPGSPGPALPPTSPISPISPDTATVPAEDGQGVDVVDVSTKDLTVHHDIKLRMGPDRPDRDCGLSDNNPLHRTGTWSWMAADLIMAGPGQPVVHTAAHDLESLFYVLLGICVLFRAPYTPKSDRELDLCFDKYFNTYGPSLSKTITIQSDLGWHREIRRHISPYFQPLIPLLEALRKIIIMPITDCAISGIEPSSDNRVTHLQVIEELEKTLIALPDEYWRPHHDPREQLVDPIVEYSLRKFARAPATDGLAEGPGVDGKQSHARGLADAYLSSTDERTTTDTEVAPAEGGSLCYPRFPRPSDVRAPSGPGFEHHLRAKNNDDADYEDSATLPRKRRRSTSRNAHSTGKNRHLHRRPLPIKLHNKTTGYLTQRSKKPAQAVVTKRARPAGPTGEGSSARSPLDALVYMHAPPVYMHARTEPALVRYAENNEQLDDPQPELEGLRSSSLTSIPSSESD